MTHSSLSSNIQLIGISQKVWHKILYSLARSVAVEQLAKRQNSAPAIQKKKGIKKSTTV